MTAGRYYKSFQIKPSTRIRLGKWDPKFIGEHTKKEALRKIEKLREQISDMQMRLYAEHQRSLLICLQGQDASGKDGVVRHVIGSMNPEGCRVVNFKEPTKEELDHDFLWRIEHQMPRKGEAVIFNRSHYEDVLIVRVHDLVPKSIWSRRYKQINDFEQRQLANGTHILKFFLHISKEEQLERFEQRLDDPAKRWKISEADYTEREYWEEYEKAYEEVFAKCNSTAAPWFLIPADHKWFRDLAISEIIVAALEALKIQVPKPTVDIADIRRKYHEDVRKAQRTR
jgi:PPK2 family polyphosphate:nucleotide phosphotransferase